MYKFLNLSTTGKLFFLFMGIFPLISTVSYAQTAGIVISGVVSDESGSPLPGATVLLEGSSTGVVTDVSGRYTISVPNSDAVLVFSSVGYATQEVVVTDQTGINIALSEDARALEEVVVVGLASTIKRSNAANQVVRITGKELVGATTPSTLDGALSGKVIGARIYQNGGAPGGGVSI